LINYLKKFFQSLSGSTYESLFTGKSILALPIILDQFGNADKLVSAGVALKLDKMERLQKDERIQVNAKRLKTLAIINSKRKIQSRRFN